MAFSERALPTAVATTVAGVALSVTAAVLFGRSHDGSAAAVTAAAFLGTLPGALSALAVQRRLPRTVTPADRVTLGRAALACACAAMTAVVVLGNAPARSWWLVGLVVPTLALDAVDGLVARRTGTATAAGALLDMQVDAGVLVVLSVAAATVLGPWVLLVGALRYLFVATTRLRPGWRRTLPRSRFRRTVAALQGAVLTSALVPLVPIPAARTAVALGVVLLLVSFGTQILALERLDHTGPTGSGAPDR